MYWRLLLGAAAALSVVLVPLDGAVIPSVRSTTVSSTELPDYAEEYESANMTYV